MIKRIAPPYHTFRRILLEIELKRAKKKCKIWSTSLHNPCHPLSNKSVNKVDYMRILYLL